MHFSFLAFTSFLLSSASAGEYIPLPDSFHTEFKLLDSRTFAKDLHVAIKDRVSAAPGMETLCYFSYCHGKRTDARKKAEGGCADLCVATAAKFNQTIVATRWMLLDSKKQPDADKATCVKECKIECGKSDCKKECPQLCEYHWSYKNRKEYEAEYYRFMIKIRDYPRNF